jgi:hypothetical protein
VDCDTDTLETSSLNQVHNVLMYYVAPTQNFKDITYFNKTINSDKNLRLNRVKRNKT